MMPTLDDLFDGFDLEEAVAAGYVRRQTHPTARLQIYNYTELTQYERAWNPLTRQCRGLIAHADTGQILARPFPKAHNHDEPDAPTFAADEPVTVTDKVDGSLGIGYPTGIGYAIATRGAFVSEQALHASEVWRTRYADTALPVTGITPLWEIVYPANRIVVDYGAMDDLVLLGGIHIESGEFVPPALLATAMRWPGPVVEQFPYATFAEVFSAAPRAGREGFVIRSQVTGAAVKFKYAEYVALHRLVTGMNERIVWEHLGAGRPLAELIEPLPDEFHGWVRAVADRLTGERDRIAELARTAHAEILTDLPDGWLRRDYAMAAQQIPELRPWLFNILDGRDPGPGIWKTLRPSGLNTMTLAEDAAGAELAT